MHLAPFPRRIFRACAALNEDLGLSFSHALHFIAPGYATKISIAAERERLLGLCFLKKSEKNFFWKQTTLCSSADPLSDEATDKRSVNNVEGGGQQLCPRLVCTHARTWLALDWREGGRHVGPFVSKKESIDRLIVKCCACIKRRGLGFLFLETMRFVAGTALAKRVDLLARKWPIAFACGTATVKTTSADLLVQTAVERKKWAWPQSERKGNGFIDWRRTAAFSVFGLVWMGGAQYGIYSVAFERLFPASRLGQFKSTGMKVFVDQFLHVPFLFFPVFYGIDGWIKEKPVLHHVEQKWRTEIKATLFANWKLWLPAQAIGFSVVSPHLRVPYVAAVSFIWTSIFSVMQGQYQDEKVTSLATDAQSPTFAAVNRETETLAA